ncbi:MAG TPA: chloride channel protein [Syntrophales bacterium]|nr:chloride channel protein [Syntrophales bacterium]HPQ44519.1 chloride channel protein [Syntrophales bacterium]
MKFSKKILPTHLHANEHAVMIVMATIVGILGGYGAILFRWLIRFFQKASFGTIEGDFLSTLMNLPWHVRLIPPVIGGLLVGIIVYFFAREAKGHGVPEVMEAVALKGGIIRKRVVLVKSLASAICIGTGGSAGREGPIVQIGSAIGSTFGQLLKVSADRMRTLVGCGAAAGIAATFNAPIAGVMFAMEIILGEFGIATFSPIVVSSVMATVISRAYLGNFPAFIVPHYTLVSTLEMPFYVVLGILAGVFGVIFTATLYKIEDLFSLIKIPDYTKAAVGGLIVGIIGISLPHVYGVGYDAIGFALLEKLPWYMLIALVFAKIFATSFTIGSGGSGGIFAPSLFIGSMLGGAFGSLVHHFFPTITATYGAYSLVGMGALVAGATHGPITAILILFEMTGEYRIILPLMLSCILSSVIASQIKKESIYTMKLIRRGTDIKAGKEVNIMKSLLVKDTMTRDVETVSEDMHLNKLLEHTFASKRSSFPVVNRQGLLCGIITFQDFKEVVFEEGLGDLVVVKDIAIPDVITITGDNNLDEALKKIGLKNIEQLPVVDKNNPRKIVGILSRRDIFSAYNKALINRSLARGIEEKG